MLKFLVVVYRQQGWSGEEFRKYFENTHGGLTQKMPGLLRYTQNFVAKDPTRKHPGWDAIIELCFAGFDEIQAAWQSPEGVAATEDLKVFCDLERTTWSVVEERIVRR